MVQAIGYPLEIFSETNNILIADIVNYIQLARQDSNNFTKRSKIDSCTWSQIQTITRIQTQKLINPLKKEEVILAKEMSDNNIPAHIPSKLGPSKFLNILPN